MYSGSVHMFYPQWPTPQSARQKTLVESLAWVRETRPLWIGLSQNIHAFSLSLSQSGRTHTEERPIAWNKNYVQQSTHTHTLHEMNNHIQLIFFPFFIYIYIYITVWLTCNVEINSASILHLLCKLFSYVFMTGQNKLPQWMNINFTLTDLFFHLSFFILL